MAQTRQDHTLTTRVLIWAHRRLSPFVRRPGVMVCTGVMLLIIGVAETLEVLIPGIESALHTAHGVVIFGVVTLMRGLVEMVEGLEVLGLDAEANAPAEGGNREPEIG